MDLQINDIVVIKKHPVLLYHRLEFTVIGCNQTTNTVTLKNGRFGHIFAWAADLCTKAPKLNNEKGSGNHGG